MRKAWQIIGGFIKNALLYVTGALVVLGALPVHAGLVDLGDRALDESTGLEWLKLDRLVGYSYEAVAGGALGYTNAGWRFAKKPEVIDLATTYIGALNGQYSDPVSGLASSYVDGANALVVALGMNLAFNDERATYNITWSYPGLHQISIQGFFDDESAIDSRNGFAEMTAVLADASNIYGYLASDSPVPFGRWLAISDFLEANRAGPNISSFLVRESNKVPTSDSLSLALVALCLLGSSIVRRPVVKLRRPE